MGVNREGDPHHVVVKRSPLSCRGGFSNMMTTYHEHGADNLSIWLTNARDAAAKIRESTMKKRKEKKEKYVKFLKDLHLRVAESSREKKAGSALIPPAKISRLVQADSDRKDAEETKDLLKQASRMEDVRSFLEAQVRKKERSPPTAKNGDPVVYRECMAHARRTQKKEPQTSRKVTRNEDEPVVTIANEDISVAPIVKPFVVVIPPPPGPQKPELVMSEPCTPRYPLDGWTIPTSFSALDMRDVDELVALASPGASEKKFGLSKTKVPPLVLPPSRKDRKRCESETFAQKLSARRKLRSDNSRTFCRAISSDLSMKCCERMRSKLTSIDSVHEKKLPPETSCGTAIPRFSPYFDQLRNHVLDPVDCPRLPNGDGVTTCSMGVVVMRDREEYENRRQGKQFSDVWKCAMDAERRVANERARLLSDVKKNRLKRLQIEKQQKAAMLKERALTIQRTAVQTHLEMVASLKVKRDDAIKRNRILEKRRFADALRAIRIEKLQGYGLRVPPLCNCNHGEDPLNPDYIRRCQNQCKLRNHFPEYMAQLERTLQHVLLEVCSLLDAQARERRAGTRRI